MNLSNNSLSLLVDSYELSMLGQNACKSICLKLKQLFVWAPWRWFILKLDKLYVCAPQVHRLVFNLNLSDNYLSFLVDMCELSMLGQNVCKSICLKPKQLFVWVTWRLFIVMYTCDSSICVNFQWKIFSCKIIMLIV